MGAFVGSGPLQPALLWWVSVVVALLVATRPVRRLLVRREMARRLSLREPWRRAEATGFARRAVPLWRRPPGLSGFPADPFALTVPVVVAPLGDGRPGEAFQAPRAPLPGTDQVVSDGSRTDAQLPLARHTRFAVVCLGRVGSVRHGRVLLPAPDRVGLRRAALPAGLWALDAATRRDTPAGPAWRQSLGSVRSVLTDTHLDRAGFAFVVGVFAPHEQRALAGVVDRVLETWQWLDDPAGARRRPEPPVRPDAVGDEVAVAVGGPHGLVASFLAPAPDRLPEAAPVPPEGQRPEALVVLSPTAELAVVSEPLTSPASARVVGRAVAPLGLARDKDGPAQPVTTAAGEAWRARYRNDGGFVSDEVELDHGGRAWTLVLSRGPDDAMAGVLDRALATWRWEG